MHAAARGLKDTQVCERISAPFPAAITTAVLASAGLAAHDEAFAKEGYRWTAANGPFAYPAKGDLQTMSYIPTMAFGFGQLDNREPTTVSAAPW
jgi:hypothetical protein